MIRGTKRAMVSEPDTGTPNKNKIDLALMAKIHNRWDVEVVDAATGEVKQRARGFNVICNGWWQYVPIGYGFGTIHYGRGSGTPSASDTALFSEIGTKSGTTTYDVSTLDQEFVSWTVSCQLAPGDSVGETITEVGLCEWSSSSYPIFTHAMLEDMNGNPISIIKTATDIVNIYATVFLHITTDRYANGKNRLTKEVAWMRGFSAYEKGYNGIRALQAADRSNSVFSKIASHSYDSSLKKTTMAATQLSASSANVSGGLLCLVYGYLQNNSYPENWKNFMILFPASKSQILNEAVGTGDGSTQNFKTKFAFPSDATIYVDGVAQASGVTVVADHPSLSARLDRFLAPIALVTASKLVLLQNVAGTVGWSLAPSEERMYEKAVDGLVMDWIVLSSATAAGNVTIWASDDLETWTDVGSTMSSSQWWTIPAPYNAAKYYKIKNNKTSGNIILNGGARSGYDGYAIRFDTPPAAGAVITADYLTPMIPKDDNHLMDVSMTVTFGEYTGEEI